MKYDLEQRLIKFAVLILKIVDSLPQDRACSNLASQLSRSGTAPALLYGEAQAAESRKDFVHKMKIGLKELKETKINLQIIAKGNLIVNDPILTEVLQECDELNAIFHKSITTATKNIVALGNRSQL